MGSMSLWHWVIVLVIVVLLFGRGRIADIMGDMGKGIKSFKKSMAEDEVAADKRLADAPPATPAPSATASGEPRQL